MQTCFFCAAVTAKSSHTCPNCARDFRRFGKALFVIAVVSAGLTALAAVVVPGSPTAARAPDAAARTAETRLQP